MPPNPFSDGSSATRVIAISSGKGGVGKSSVTVNLAVALASAGYRVGLLDADVYGFSVPAMLGLSGEPVVSEGRVTPLTAFGLSVISMGFFVGDDQPVIWRGPMLHKALEQFLVDVDWAGPDFLVVDMPPGTGDVALSMSQYLPASEVYVVTTPQPAARRVAQRSTYMARKLEHALARRDREHELVQRTRRDQVRDLRPGRRRPVGRGAGRAVARSIPLVAAIREGGDAGRPVVAAAPASEAAAAFRQVAERIVGLGRSRVFRQELRIT